MLPEKPPADLAPKPAVNMALVALLERTLAEAKAGAIVGGALVVCDPAMNAQTRITAPPHLACVLVGGAEFLKAEIIAMVREQQNRGSSILRAAAIPRQ